MSVFGTRSPRVYETVVADALARRIDCRIATASNQVCGAVIAAPRSYWRSCLLRHPAVALECVRTRISARSPHRTALSTIEPVSPPAAGRQPDARDHDIVRVDVGPPRVTWSDPRDAWRIIIVGTVPEARGLGIAAALYRAMMRERSLVARIARDNDASLRLHLSVGWQLYADGDVVLAVHTKPDSSI